MKFVKNHIKNKTNKIKTSKFKCNLKLLNYARLQDNADSGNIFCNEINIESFKQKSKVMIKSENTQYIKNSSNSQISRQNSDDKYLKIYNGYSNDVDEDTTLIDNKLNVSVGIENNIIKNNLRSINTITLFNVHYKNGHLCSLESVLEKNVNIYISGYVKPITCDNESIPNMLTKDIGPIVKWIITGSDSHQKATIILCTTLGEYLLMQPSKDYKPFMILIRDKIFLCKIIIECLLSKPYTKYEELLSNIETMAMPHGLSKFTEDLLINNAEFICKQITLFDAASTTEGVLLIHAPCIKVLIDLAGIKIQTDLRNSKINYQQNNDWLNSLRSNQKKSFQTNSTITQEIYKLFKKIYQKEVDDIYDNLLLKHKIETDLEECCTCKKKIKFDYPRPSKKAIISNCSNIQLKSNDHLKYHNDHDNINNYEFSTKVHNNILKKKKSLKATWIGEPILSSKGNFYDAVMINFEKIERNDYICIESIDSSVSMQVIKVRYLWETKLGLKMLHGTWLWKGSQTILGKMSCPRELFLVDECQDVPLTFVQSKANVFVLESSNKCNGKDNSSQLLEKNSESFFCQKRYDNITARFEDILPDLEPPQEKEHCFCSTCARDLLTKQYRIPQLFEKSEKKDNSIKIKYGMVKYLNEEFRVGSAVYLKPGTLDFKYLLNKREIFENTKKNIFNKNKYPELYRKAYDNVKSTNFDIPEPFDVGYITSIYATTKSKLLASINLYVTVKKLFRPENTHISELFKKRSDINILFWSDEECDVRFNNVIGKCYIMYLENLNETVEQWSTMGPNRFYFSESYDSKNEQFIEPSFIARKIGKNIKTESYMISKNNKINLYSNNKAICHPQIHKKLKMLDIFSGCGGLSEGLKLSGVAESHWAVENDEAAAHTYRLNNQNASVFTIDCNTFLKKIMNGVTSLNGQKLPQKGEVDLLCAGPPSEEFSNLNHFNSKAYVLFKNSLVLTCLLFCDYYKPRFFIMESIRKFVLFKKSEILKLTLSFLVQMGYQCTFGILQVGNYGVPQIQRRMILLAAASGEILPKFPKPLHVFSNSSYQLHVDIDNIKYFTSNKSYNSAPYRAVTVYDALSDLPEIKSNNNENVMKYLSEPITHFQRKMRYNVRDELFLLYDHISKDLGPLAQARIKYIPTKIGSDWRNLPNISIRLSDGSYTNKLEYNYYNKKPQINFSTEAFRDICSCENKLHIIENKQINTLIPWFLSYTADQHKHWVGLYGRLEWDNFFSATTINPTPMGKKGCVLHPEQPRVVSVRECARSQGFSDNYRFYGSIQDKYKQIGNAVPPPLGTAVGYEIRKSIDLRKREANDIKIK